MFIAARDGDQLELPKSELAAQLEIPAGKRLAVFIPSLAGGGVAQVILRLVASFAERGHPVDLVMCRAEGAFSQRIPDCVRAIELRKEPEWQSRLRVLAADPFGIGSMLLPVLLPLQSAPPFLYLGDLARYLREEEPDVLFAAKTHTNLVALWARRVARSKTRIVVSERTHLSRDLQSPKIKKWRWRFVVPLIHRVYPWADAIVAVSDGVAEDLAKTARIDRRSVTTIYNPDFTSQLVEKVGAPLDDPWFAPGAPPVILGVGRFVPQKDFPTLLRAFTRVRAKRDARLIILGEGKDSTRRDELLELAKHLGNCGRSRAAWIRAKPLFLHGASRRFRVVIGLGRISQRACGGDRLRLPGGQYGLSQRTVRGAGQRHLWVPGAGGRRRGPGRRDPGDPGQSS